MLARAARTAPGRSMPPLQNLSLKTAATKVAYAPNRQFNITVRMENFAALFNVDRALYNKIFNGMPTSDTLDGLSPLSELHRPLETDLIVWMKMTDMPDDTERLRYAGIIHDKVTNLQSESLTGQQLSLADRELRKLIPVTPPDAPFMFVSQCNPWSGTTTMVWRASSVVQMNALGRMIGVSVKSQVQRVTGTADEAPDPFAGVGWRDNGGINFANVLFPLDPQSSTNPDATIVRFTRPPERTAAAAASDIPEQTERWQRTDMGAVPRGKKFRFVYLSDARPEDNDGGQRKKARR